MRFKASRIVALILAGSMLFSQAVFADTVVAEMPDTGTTSTSSTTSTTVDISEAVSSGSGYISASGPGGSTATTDSSGYVIIGNSSMSAEDTTDSSATGPGSTTAATTTTTTTTTTEAAENTGTAATVSSSGLLTIDGSVTEPEISSSCAILYDASTWQVLYEKNADTQMYPASTTKLMTALLTVENLGLDDTITFTSEAVNGLESGATTVSMAVGDTMTVEDALHAMLMKSACDVAIALGVSISGSEEAFADLMTQRAAELGCTNTNFENASGLNNEAHLTTVRDMALITRAALANDTIRTITQKRSYQLPATSSRSALTITNTNHFVEGGSDPLDGYLGGKTGYTSKAGQCLATAASVGEREFIAVVFKAQSPNQYNDSRSLYEYAGELLEANGLSSDTSTTASSSSTSTSTLDGTWEVGTDNKMMYKLEDGTYLKSQWLDLGENTYFFDSEGYMCTGWKKFSNGAWYYFHPETGIMVRSQWVTINNKSYYMQSDGVMATSTVVDGMYRVDENGVYVELVG